MAIINPYNSDARINGQIFNKEVFQEEIEELKEKIDSRINLIYITGGGWERGVGKSALVVQEWRRLSGEPDITSIYIKVRSRTGPIDFCDDIVQKWHKDGFLWEALKRLLVKYSEENGSPRIGSSDAKAFILSYPKMTDDVQFGLFTFLYKTEAVVTDMTKWICAKSAIANESIARSYIDSYLTKPSRFPDQWLKITRSKIVDKIESLRTIIELMRISGFAYHYFFLDQFEEVVEPLRGASLSVFSVEMRNLLTACAGSATIVVTLHPFAENALNAPEGKQVTSLATPDKTHKVDVNLMGATEGVKICLSYMGLFRTSEPENPLHPFDEDAVKYLAYIGNCVPRLFLEIMNRAIEVGVSKSWARITLSFIEEHHEEITGKVFIKEKLEEFLKYAR
jgi:AAA+ ATPase superfamily predicted ATPase